MAETELRRIWIINHYASCPEYPNEHRHHDFARVLVKRGFDVTIFAASTMHNMNVNLADEGSMMVERFYDGVRYVFIKSRSYKGNGLNRILNMRDYIKGLKIASDVFASEARPDLIWASSPQLFSLRTALDIAADLHVPCVCEVRDLWPQSLIEYGYLKGTDPVSRYLFRREREAYERADALIFTMAGGADYIKDKGWSTLQGGKVDLEKVHYVNNGINLAEFDRNKLGANQFSDVFDEKFKTVVYSGSIRQVNNIDFIVDVAELMQNEDVRFLIVGDGDALPQLQKRVSDLGLTNITFAGRVDRSAVPAILADADLLLLHSSSQHGLSQYGMSQNKLFDYLASGKPILSNLPSAFSIINAKGCGVEREFDSPSDYAEQIRLMLTDDEMMLRWSENAREAVQAYSFEALTDSLVDIMHQAQKYFKEEQ